MACHLQPYRTWRFACKMSLMMIGSCIILNCCNSKIAKCFTTLMRVAFFCTRRLSVQPFNNYMFPRFSAFAWPSAPCRSSKRKFHERRRVSSCEKPKITMPVGTLVRRQGGYWGGQDSKSTEPTNSSTSSIRGEIIPMHCNLFSLNPPKNIKNTSNNGDSIGIAPLEMSKSSHLLQLNNLPILIS